MSASMEFRRSSLGSRLLDVVLRLRFTNDVEKTERLISVASR
jgi:hypothetical protein